MLGKAIIYQVLPRLWNTSRKEGALKVSGSLVENGSGHFSSIDEEVLAYLHNTLHVSHVWYTGIIRHASGYNDWVEKLLSFLLILEHPQFFRKPPHLRKGLPRGSSCRNMPYLLIDN